MRQKLYPQIDLPSGWTASRVHELLAPKTWSDDGMKMLINTGNKTFDRQTVTISTGNVFSPTQTSSYLRAFNDVHIDGDPRLRSPGELLRFDCDTVDRHMPRQVVDAVTALCHTKGGILYRWSHIRRARRRGEAERVVHAYVLTTREYVVRGTWCGPGMYSAKVLHGCLPYVGLTPAVIQSLAPLVARKLTVDLWLHAPGDVSEEELTRKVSQKINARYSARSRMDGDDLLFFTECTMHHKKIGAIKA